MAYGFLDLPDELISIILLSDLSLSDIAHMRIQCTLLDAIADHVLRYYYDREIKTAAFFDVFPQHVPLLEQLSRLGRREDAWCHFNPTIRSGKEVPSILIHTFTVPTQDVLKTEVCVT